jgi:nicotinamide riboside kinase
MPNAVHRIAITGTESTGKTTLAEQLSTQLNVFLLPDVSREYIAALQRPYTKEDVLEIARQIIQQEEEAAAKTQKVFLSDNDLINIKIWLSYYNWKVPDWLQSRILLNQPSLYLLCFPDIPWVADEQRANPLDRDKLYSRFVAEIEAIKAPYQVLKGSELERLYKAKTLVEKFL